MNADGSAAVQVGAPMAQSRGPFLSPMPLSLEGDMWENWQVFEEQWRAYELATGLTKKQGRSLCGNS